ncbi:MAG: hypothetical protein ABF709_06395 [Leuconostoc pseudomesenteroides]|uniref:hypothetical protein n=1 Tax=Lactobacillaceae TaxID=33958 RepID=UPI001E4F7479|nr:hypothetical protein [Leuconostoc pseudomesenteroides]MCC7669252.1 hypothetical protein [Leuconostoc pseudomesenteroides]
MIDSAYTSLPLSSIRDKVTIFSVDGSMTDSLEKLSLQILSDQPKYTNPYKDFLRKRLRQIQLIFLCEIIVVTSICAFWMLEESFTYQLKILSLVLYMITIGLLIYRLTQYKLLKKSPLLFSDYHQNGFKWPKDNVSPNQPWNFVSVIESDNYFVIHLILEISYFMSIKRRAIYIPKSELSSENIKDLQKYSLKGTKASLSR